MLQVGKVATQVDIFPFGIGAGCACAPQAEAAIDKVTEAVDAFGIEHGLLAAVDHLLEAQGEGNDLVGRCFIHATINIAASVDASDEAAGRQIYLLARDRVENAYPRVIEGRIA